MTPPPPRALSVQCLDPRLRIRASACKKVIAKLDAPDALPLPQGDVNLIFVDPVTCRKLHQDYFNDPEITDVMTFPGDAADHHLGDIAICPEAAANHVAASGQPFAEELILYLVHAWCHLAGMEDASAKGRAAMRREEDRLMAILKAGQLIPDSAWQP